MYLANTYRSLCHDGSSLCYILCYQLFVLHNHMDTYHYIKNNHYIKGDHFCLTQEH